MSFEWVRQRELDKRQSPGSFKTEDDFSKLLESISPEMSSTIDELSVRALGDAALVGLQEDSRKLAAQAGFEQSDEISSMFLCWICARAVARNPSIEVWGKIKTLAYHSSEIQHWVGYAMAVQARRDEQVKAALVELATRVFQQLDDFSGEAVWNRYAEPRRAQWEHWQRCTSQLDELWWGLRWSDLMSYQEDFPLFNLLWQFSPDSFIQLLGAIRNPNLVQSALVVTGAGPFTHRFAEWTCLAAGGPVAFREDGSWSGSSLLPLLLVAARNEIHETGRSMLRGNQEVAGEAIADEIRRACREVATVAMQRRDASGILLRWSAWLMRNLLGATTANLNDPRTVPFADCAFLEAIGEAMRGRVLISGHSPDAGAWEPWCNLCAYSFFASNGSNESPDPDVFLNEWALSADDWESAKGRDLRGHAGVVISLTKEVPGLAAQLLAYAILQTPNALLSWRKAWEDASRLREIVEFGDAGAAENEYSNRSEAGRLLLLLYRIGLAMLDQKFGQISTANTDEARLLAIHFGELSASIYEMAEIENTLNRQEWETAILHLATRRFMWEQPLVPVEGGGAMFLKEDRPSAADFLDRARRNPAELLQILLSVAMNSPDTNRLTQVIKEASLDLPAIIESMRCLNKFDVRRYPLDEDRLDQLLDLMR